MSRPSRPPSPPPEALLIFHLRTARCKAREAALAEAVCLLDGLHPSPQPGGPHSERGGRFWISLPFDAVEEALLRLPRLGYTHAADLLRPENASRASPPHRSEADHVRWRGAHYTLDRVYEEDPEAIRDRAPDRRDFLLELRDGTVRIAHGYRGNGREGSRRGLPVCDCRLLVNLAGGQRGKCLLDPFAGSGGIGIEALENGCTVFTLDHDPALRHGLARQGACHVVADAAALPFPDRHFDGIATEPPYHPGADPVVIAGLREMARVTKPEGRIALLCATRQAEPLRREGARLGWITHLDCPIDRKGLPVSLLTWINP